MAGSIGVATAQSSDSIQDKMKDFPQEVTKWKSWVQANNPDLDCPSVFGERNCLFMGDFSAQMNGKNISFKQEFHVFSNQIQVKLPKIINEQTQQSRYVQPNEKYNTVKKNNEFFIILKKGTHVLNFSDSFASSEKLMLNHDFAIMKIDKNLNYSNSTISLASFNEAPNTNQNTGINPNATNLPDPNTPQANTDIKTEVEVFRLFEDSVPSVLTTYIDIKNFNNAKKISLGRVIPDGFDLNEYSTNLSMEFKDGEFSVFAPVGQHRIGFKATSKNLINKINTASLVTGVSKETWGFSPVDNIRQFEVIGAQQLDPSKTNMPEIWRGFITYSVTDGLELNTLRMGILTNQSTDIVSSRSTWIGFNNSKVYHFDRANLVNKGAPFLSANMSATNELTPLSVKANNQNQVLFQKQENTGILVNVGNYDISSNWTSGKEIPLSLWSSDNAQIQNWSLNVAPRQNILWVSSNNSDVVVRGSWLDSWNLYKVFSLFIIGLAFFKIFGKKTAALSVVGIFVMNSYFIVSWTLWLTLLFFVAILKVSHLFKDTRFYRFIKISSIVCLLSFAVVSVEFIAKEIKLIMNPHLETKYVTSYQYNNQGLGVFGNNDEVAASAPAPAMSSMPQEAMMESSAPRSMGKSSPFSSRSNVQSIEEFNKESQEVSKYVAQVSGSMPAWSQFAGKTYSIDVLSPVTKDSSVSFVISPVWLTALFSVLQIITLLVSLASFSMVVFQINNRQDVVDAALFYINSWRKK